jgi:phage terminase Nu1 subunit (DNA packaging protein)
MDIVELKNIIVSSKDLCEILDYDHRYISELVRDHGLPRKTHNQYPLVECVEWDKQYQKKITEKKINEAREKNSRSRLETAQAEMKELELKKMHGTLAPIEDFKIIFTNWSQLFKKSVENIGAVLKFDLNLNENDQEIVDKKIINILTQLSQLPVNIDANSIEFK